MLKGVLVLVGFLVVYLAAWPVPIAPVVWTPLPTPALEGPYARNDRLAAVRVVARGAIGPEATAIDSQGRVYAGLADGRIVRLAGEGFETVVSTGGRPLGMAFDGAGRLIVADALKGLLAVGPAGRIETLVSSYEGQPLGFPDDVALGSDGTIYFSDAARGLGYGHAETIVLEHRPTGRLFAYHPAERRLQLLADRLYFANGVAVSADDTYLLVNETSNYRVLRYWLAGPHRGRLEPFAENLPGFPDNVTRSPRGIYWVALYSPRVAAADALAGWPSLRKAVLRLPRWLRPAAIHHAFVLGLDAEGHVVHNLQDASPMAYAPVTSAREHEGRLYLGSLRHDGIAVLDAP